MEIGDRIADGTAAASPVRRISLRRAYGELLAVYIPSFGLGIISALILLTNRNQQVDQINGPVNSLVDISQYVMQASVTIFGVGYFCQRRGVTLGMLFGRFKDPGPHPPPLPQPLYPPQPEEGAWPVQAPPVWPGYAGYGHYMPPQPPAERDRGWQFSRAYFLSMGGVLGFLISVIVYTALRHVQTGAPSQGNSPYLVLVGVFVALAAGFGEEMLVTGLTVNALEAAGVGGKRVWLIYLTAICLRIPFHLYYGWAALGVIIFTTVNIWVYRRWRLLWPIVLAHATYDFVESLGAVTPAGGGLLLFALGLTTLVMVIIIVCIESSDSSSRRRFQRYNGEMLAAQAAYAAHAAQLDQNRQQSLAAAPEPLSLDFPFAQHQQQSPGAQPPPLDFPPDDFPPPGGPAPESAA